MQSSKLNRPIGILDSGVGGLSIWKEIKALLPKESTIYVADSKNCPYGPRSEREIYKLAKDLVKFLIKKKVKLIILACNTVTVFCLDRLRRDFPKIPIIGAVPVVKTAAKMSKNRRIGILSTSATSKSLYQKRLIHKFASNCDVVNIGTDKLVPFIEKGDIYSQKFKTILKRELKEFVDKNVDIVALGCSHFPFVKKQIQEILGKDISLFDSGKAIARQVGRVLEDIKITGSLENVSHTFYTTGDEVEFRRIIGKLAGNKLKIKIEGVLVV